MISIDASSSLYRVALKYFDKENPNSGAVKRISSGEGYDKARFYREIEMLSSIKHPNIVTLLGFCDEGSEMILLIDDVSNGPLGNYFGNRSNKSRIFTWEERLKICIDVACALRYIHYEMEEEMMLINRGICSRSIGLDENWVPKIIHFGFGVFQYSIREKEILVLDRCGPMYAWDPENKKLGLVNRKTDVYGFGVLMLQILCGRALNDPTYLNESSEGLVGVVRNGFNTGKLENMIDPAIKEEECENNFFLSRGPNKDSLETFTRIANNCILGTLRLRPTMKEVVQELEKSLLHQKNNKENPRISLEDIEEATQNFNDRIGKGGFGKVYRGQLRDGDGFKTIVAKKLDKGSDQGEAQFLNELEILLNYKHENVIGLVGYCNEKSEKIIVYEYASGGSLDQHLNNASLTWIKRLNICIDVARALDFLHGGVGKQAKVIHRDIKTENILVSNDWKGKLADFGLSLISPLTREGDYVIDHWCGTPGYIDPVYQNSRYLTMESDIYSFGVVLFEILCGKSTFAVKHDEGRYLPDFIKSKFEEGQHDKVVFEHIREQISPESLTTFQEIAYQCLQSEREKRPTMKAVLRKLKNALELQNMASSITKCASFKIPLEDVIKATNNFHHKNIIGQDRLGHLYKGQLLRFRNLVNITARRLDRKRGLGDLEFWTEVTVLSDLKHTNLGSIIGFCNEKDEKIILSTYEANGSLRGYLNSSNLTWQQRLKICIGVARALSYLHHD
ncbi:uncharacterized protein LOC143547634 [Bidens hawaiensis]|uniref:uncharacterized protein LOC143547634 n=1 Tax=Bidens hawaiensis TaxID=980011 RepID=UPI00404A60B6